MVMEAGAMNFVEGVCHTAVEPSPAPTVYISGVASAKVIKGVLHMLLYVDQPSAEGDIERVANLRLCMPLSGHTMGRAIVDRAIQQACVTNTQWGEGRMEPILVS